MTPAVQTPWCLPEEGSSRYPHPDPSSLQVGARYEIMTPMAPHAIMFFRGWDSTGGAVFAGHDGREIHVGLGRAPLRLRLVRNDPGRVVPDGRPRLPEPGSVVYPHPDPSTLIPGDTYHLSCRTYDGSGKFLGYTADGQAVWDVGGRPLHVGLGCIALRAERLEAL